MVSATLRAGAAFGLVVTSFFVLPAGIGALAQDAAVATAAVRPASGDVARLRADVEWLAHADRAGRRAGEPGEIAAAAWIAERLAKLGLEPAGAGGWYHEFEVPLAPRDLGTSGVVVHDGPAALRGALAGARVEPLSFSAAGDVRGELAFVGFGLVAGAPEWDDYTDMLVDGKIVLMARGVPRSPEGTTLDFGASAGLFSKAMAAKRRGAVAVLIAQHPDAADEPLPKFHSGPTGLATLPALAIGAELAEALAPGYSAAVRRIDEESAAGRGRFVHGAMGSLGTDVSVVSAVARERGTARNVLGLLRGSDPAAPLVVVGAHYDHVGRGETGSLSPAEIGRIHHGADDNASGTAAVLDAARLLAASGSKSDVLFAFWSGEELGLLGSKHWIAANAATVERVSLNVNLDMVGRVRDAKLTVLGSGSSPVFAEALPGIGEEAGLTLALEPSGRAVGGSDHQSFLERRVPALHLFSGLHADYHRPSDTADKIEYGGLAAVTGFTVALVRFAQTAGELPFSEVALAAEPGRARGEGWRVWFGTIPEYTDQGPGLLISGTSPGSPAERAGLLGGDRIVQVGDAKIEGMADFMHALSVHKPGEVVKVEFLRDGVREEVLLTLAARDGR